MLKILHCSPGDLNSGGIPAVVKGFTKGFEYYSSQVNVKRIIYAKSKPNLRKTERIVLEIFQLFNFIWQLISYNPTIVHFQSSFGKSAIIRDAFFFKITKLFGNKIIVHAHGGHWHELDKWSKALQRKADYWAKNADCVIVTSNEEYKLAKIIWGEKINIQKLNNPIILNNIVKDNNNGNTEIIFASRLIEEKGILDLLNSVKYIKSKNYSIKIFGNGPLENKIEVIIKENNIEENVKFIGQVPFEELIDSYNNADVFVFPSYHLEGFPMAFFYALSCNLAIITTKVRPIPEYLKDNINCKFINEKDPKSIANSIDTLISDKELINTMKSNNIELVKQFDYIKITKDLISIYNTLIK